MSRQTDKFRALTADVRKAFKGRLTYIGRFSGTLPRAGWRAVQAAAKIVRPAFSKMSLHQHTATSTTAFHSSEIWT
jgi:hypothetical protein